MFCVFNIISVAPGAQGGLILAQVPLCLALHKYQLEQPRADETRRVNANKPPPVDSHFGQLSFPEGLGFIRPADTMRVEWGVVAGDTFAEVTAATSWLESPTAEEPPQLLFGVSSPPVPRGEEGRQSVCPALTHSAPVYAARVCFPHYSLFHLPEGTEYSFPLCHK